MTLTFPVLLVLLLPGFFALWVYQGLCFEDVHKRGEAHVISLGLMFGMVNLGVYALLGCLPWFSLAILVDDNVAVLMSWAFLWRYVLLSILALFVGLVSGLLCRKGWTPTAYFRRAGARLLGVNETQNTESLLHVFLQEHTKDGSQVIIEIKNGSDSVMGFYGGDGLDSEGEIQLWFTSLFESLTSDGLRDEILTPLEVLYSPDVFLRPSGALVTVTPLSSQEYDKVFIVSDFLL